MTISPNPSDAKSTLFEIVNSGDLTRLQKFYHRISYDTTMGFNIDATNQNGDTALMVAVKKGNEAMVEKLLRMGSDVTFSNCFTGQSAFTMADQNSQRFIYEYLGRASSWRCSLYFHAAYLAEKGVLTKIVQHYHKTDVSLIHQRNRLYENAACLVLRDAQFVSRSMHNNHLEYDPVECLKILFSYGFSARDELRDGQSLLHVACSQIFSEVGDVVDFLLEHGAQPNRRDSKGLTPLHYAAYTGCSTALEILIRGSGDVNQLSKHGNTPLHFSSIGGHLKCVELLMDAPLVDMQLRNDAGQRPVDVANKKKVAVVNLLRSKTPSKACTAPRYIRPIEPASRLRLRGDTASKKATKPTDQSAVKADQSAIAAVCNGEDIKDTNQPINSGRSHFEHTSPLPALTDVTVDNVRLGECIGDGSEALPHTHIENVISNCSPEKKLIISTNLKLSPNDPLGISSVGKPSLTSGNHTSPLPSIASNTEPINCTVDNVRLGECIGNGSEATIFKALTSTERTIAVRVISKQETFKDVHREVEILRSISHKNIVKCFGFDKTEHSVHVYMEFVSGTTIKGLYQQEGPMTESVYQQFTHQLVGGVDYLHRSNVVHGDIKGTNIMITEKGLLKLIDFGCARNVSGVRDESKAITESLGTPNWMAPEIINGLPHGRKVDVWSIGCTVYEMAMAEPPFKRNNVEATYFAIGQNLTSVQIPDGRAPLITNRFIAICTKRDPAQRPNTEELLYHPYFSASIS